MAELYYYPPERDIEAHISAWDGDIDKRTAIHLLKINHWKDEAEKLVKENARLKEEVRLLRQLCDELDPGAYQARMKE